MQMYALCSLPYYTEEPNLCGVLALLCNRVSHSECKSVKSWCCSNIFQSLALCTSALVFMLSRDRLNMDLDQDTLNLMLRLLGVDQQEDMAATLTASAARALKRNRDKVQEVYSQFQKEAGSKQEIEIECLTVS